jgi:hypothetical protein
MTRRTMPRRRDDGGSVVAGGQGPPLRVVVVGPVDGCGGGGPVQVTSQVARQCGGQGWVTGLVAGDRETACLADRTPQV